MQKATASLFVLLSALFVAGAAHAAPVGPVDVSVDYMTEWQNEFRANSEDSAIDGTNNSFARAEIAPEIQYGHFSLDSLLTFEPMDQAATKNVGNDVFFDHEGAFVENLYLEYENGAFEAKVGKFNPDFGIAWDYGRGIWGEDFAEDYEVSEKIGAGIEYEFGNDKYGEHEVSLNTFFNDTSFLSGSAITARDETNLNTGGAGNTEDFSSFVGQVEGEDVAGIKSLGYRVAYRYLAEQDKNRSATTDSENGVLLGANYIFNASDDIAFDTLLEYTQINNFAGVAFDNRDYYYASVVTHLYDNWNVTAGYTVRDMEGTTDSTDTLFNLTGGYAFDNGLSVDAGYRGSDEAQQETHIIGFLLRYRGAWGE